MSQEQEIVTSFDDKRKKTFYVYCFIYGCLGAEYSVILPTLWFYLNDLTEDENVYIAYGVCISAYYVSSIIGGFVISKCVDKSRNNKFAITIILFTTIIGNIIYSLPFSIYFPILGRLIQGIGDVNMSIMTAEICRCYSPEEVPVKLSKMVSIFTFTFVFSPSFNMVFKLIDTNIFRTRIYYGNLPGFFLVLLLTISLLLVTFFVSDLSKIFDLKEKMNLSCNGASKQERKYEGKAEDVGFIEHEDDHIDSMAYIYKIEVIIILALVFFMSFNIVSFFEISLPLITSKYYNYDTRCTSAIFLACGILSILSLQLVSFAPSTLTDFSFIVINMCINVCSMIFLTSVSIIGKENATIGLIFLVVHDILLSICWGFLLVFSRSLLSKFIPSKHQTFYEAIRKSLSSFGCLLAGFVGVFLFDYLTCFCVVTIAITLIFIYTLHKHREKMSNPSITAI